MKHKLHKLLSVLMAMAMLVSLMPAAVFAADTAESVEDSIIVTVDEASDAAEASTEVTEPAADANEPSTEVAEPAADANEPSTEATEPAADTVEPSTEVTEPAAVCDCGTDDPAIHAVTCGVYAAPENPVCCCAEKCTEANIWCDVCGVDFTQCSGTDTAAVYENIVASGDCSAEGSNVQWKYDDTGTLTISGTGAMDSYSSNQQPWYAYMESITAVVVEDGVTVVAGNSFDSFTSLQSVTIADSVVELVLQAFRACTNLVSVRLSSNLARIGQSAFRSCKSLTSIELPQSVTFMNYSVFAYCTSLTSIEIPSGVTELKSSMFEQCTNLTSVTLPDTLTKIGPSAFTYCTSLASIEIPNSVTELGDYAFDGCTSLASIEIPDSVIQLGKGVFWGCTALTEIKLPNALQTIPTYAFWDCSNLKDITIPAGVTSVHYTAFTGIAASPVVHYLGTEAEYNTVFSEVLTKAAKHYCVEKDETLPVCNEPGHEKGWYCDTCAKYVDGGAETTRAPDNHAFSEKSICTRCGAYEAPALVNGYYEIGNMGQLYWFAQQVNIAGNTGINGKLTADIDLENRVWYPIGLYNDIAVANGSTVQKQYTGTFDGNNHTVSNFTATGNGSQGLFGYCNDIQTQIKNLGVINATVSGWNAGAVAGYCANLTNCYAVGCTITGASDINTNTDAVTISSVGGNNGYISITNCWAYDCELIVGEGETNFVMHPVGGIRGSDGTANSVQNCYYGKIETIAAFSSTTGATAKTEAQFASGEVAYLLGTAWGQTVGTDSLPVLGGAPVYEITVCETKTVYSNTDGDIPHSFNGNGFCSVTEGETHYQPATLNADGYYEIGNAGQMFWFANYINTVDRTASAVLTADIDLENRPWTPIGSTGEDSNNFRGVFDGQNHTIKGLYVEGSRAGLGFFGEVRTGTVKNFTIYGKVNVIGSYDYVGGVIGSACGLNGDNDLARNGATIQNITSYVDLTAGAHGIGMVGGFIGYANHETLIENCAWYGTFDAGIYRVDSGAGGFIGRIYDTATVTIRNCGAYGTIKTAYKSGTSGNYDTIYIGGFLSYSPSGAKTVLENNLWAGEIINNTNLDTAKAHLSAYGTLSSDISTTNCYALDNTLYVTTGNENTTGITTVTAEQLKSGEIAYKLQEGDEIWGQNIGTDAYPVLGGATVYSVDTCQGTFEGYANTEGPAHSYDNGFCTDCDAFEPPTGEGTAESPYLIGNAGQLYAFAKLVTDGSFAIHGKLTADIEVNQNVLKADGTLNEGEFREWKPIGKRVDNSKYNGTFDGQNHTVSGLYCSSGNYLGLFFRTGINGVVKNVGVVDSYFKGSGPIGGVVGSNSGTVDNCYFTGTIRGEQDLGGVVGSNSGTVTNCYNTGTIRGEKYDIGGVVGESSTTNGNVTNCYNTGTVSGKSYIGGVVGGLSNKGTMSNCYNTGTVSGTEYYVGGVLGQKDSYTKTTVTNCYYLSGCAADGSSIVQFGIGNETAGSTTADVEGQTAGKLPAQFESGEVAYLLNGDQSAIVFKQTIGTDVSPNFTGKTVYGGYNTCAEDAGMAYSNEPLSAEKPDHNYVDGTCENCGIDDPSIPKYTLTVSEAANGTVTAEKLSYAEGKTVTLTISPANDYALESLTVDGTDVTAQVQNSTYTFTMPAKAVTVTAVFAQIVYYDLWIGGEQVASNNLTISGSSGTAVYDPAANTLTLNGYIYADGYQADSSYSAAIYCGTDPLKLVLNGDSTVVRTDTVEYLFNCGIYATGNIEILDGDAEGIGSLTVTAGTCDGYISSSYGMYVVGSLTVNGGTLTANGGKTDNSYGVEADSITVKGGSLTAIGGEAVYSSYGVYTDDTITVNGGSLTAIGDKNGDGYGVFAGGAITVDGGSLTAIGGEAVGSIGVYTNSSITVNSGTLKASCGTAENSYGVRITSGLTLGSGISMLTPVGGKLAKHDYMYTIFDAEDNIATTVEIGTCTGHSFSNGKCAVCGKELFYGTNMTLGNELDLNFALETDIVPDGAYAIITRSYADNTSVTATIEKAKWTEQGSLSLITYEGLAAKEMCDTVSVTVYDKDGTALGTREDSIRSYAMRCIKDDTDKYSKEVKVLLIKMLDYGAEAQNEFGHNTGDFANKEITEQMRTDYPFEKQTVVNNGSEIAGLYMGTSLILENAIEMQMGFYGDPTGVTATVSYTDHYGTQKTFSGTEVKIATYTDTETKENVAYGVIIPEIVVADARQEVTVTVTPAEGEAITVTDSIASYAARHNSAGVYGAIMDFSDAALAYFKTQTN